ncbi:MAG: putative DNA repair protein MutK [Bacteriovoracaceae bacterium]|jgi:predicted DNA repair protein MutK
MFSLLTLLDDVASTLDDVAVMTKIAMKKTAALMSDDLAVNAGVIEGVNADRELPIVKAIFLGSLLNKVYCILGVLIIMALYPPILVGILLIGGLYLSFEGAHKVIEKIFHPKEKAHLIPDTGGTEKSRIKGAIRTDLILSIEIIVIAKSSLEGDMLQQVISLIFVGLVASFLIYGLVALIVKVDDFGLYLIKKGFKKIGLSLVRVMPKVMKGLGIVGTTAMFLVGGGIVSHTFHLPYFMPEIVQNLLMGILAGIICVIPFEMYLKYKAH